MFKVFVGRDETRALRGDQLQRFHALADGSRDAARGVADPHCQYGRRSCSESVAWTA